MKSGITAILIAFLFLAGCANMSSTEQRVLSGGAIGTAGGALIGVAAGSAAIGAAVGGGMGLLAGLAYDQHQKAQAASTVKGSFSRVRHKPKPAKKARRKVLSQENSSPPVM